jgi:hypothetical protein
VFGERVAGSAGGSGAARKWWEIVVTRIVCLRRDLSGREGGRKLRMASKGRWVRDPEEAGGFDFGFGFDFD